MQGFKNLIDYAKDLLLSRKIAYTRAFDSVEGKQVLSDLAKFCRANKTTFHDDERRSLILQGRHEVWLRIQDHLQLTQEELYQLYNGGRRE